MNFSNGQVVEDGYIIVISSFENDGDFPHETTFTGVSENELNFLKDALKLFGSQSVFTDIDCKDYELAMELMKVASKYENSTQLVEKWFKAGFDEDMPYAITFSDTRAKFFGKPVEEDVYRYMSELKVYGPIQRFKIPSIQMVEKLDY